MPKLRSCFFDQCVRRVSSRSLTEECILPVKVLQLEFQVLGWCGAIEQAILVRCGVLNQNGHVFVNVGGNE